MGEGAGVLVLPAAVLAEVRAAAVAAWPHEACGLLIGWRGGDEEWHVVRAEPTANAVVEAAGEDLAKDRFEIPPRALLTAQRTAKAQGLAVIGHYHSHPNGRTGPSPTDHAHAFWPDHAWLIIAVEAREASATAWRPDPTAAPDTPRLLPLALRAVEENARGA